MTKNYLEQSQRTALDFGQSKSEPIFPDDSEKKSVSKLSRFLHEVFCQVQARPKMSFCHKYV